MSDPRRYRILLLEDSPTDAELFLESIAGTTAARYEVDHVERTENAVHRLVDPGVYDAIVSDLNLPDTAGKETIRALRSADRRMPLVILTGSMAEEMGEWALSIGADDYLEKGPLDPELLDRTLRYAMERRRQRVLLEEAQRLANVGSFSWDIATDHVDWSNTFSRILGLEAAGGTGALEDYLARVDSRDRGRVERAVGQVAREGGRAQVEHRFERPDGSAGWGALTLHIDLGPDGEPRTAHGTFQDLTERHEQEKARAFLAAIVESAAEAVIAADPDGTITSWNEAAERIYGYTAEEAVGQSVTLIVPDDNVDEARQVLGQVAKGEPTDRFETQRLRKDGTRIDVSIVAGPIRDADGDLVGVASLSRDITERKRLQHALADERAKLREAERRQPVERVRNDFVNTASHEFGTPLTPLQIQLRLLRDEKFGPLTDDQQEALGVMQRNVDRLERLVRAVDEAVQLTTSALELARENLDVGRIVRASAADQESAARRKHVDVTVDLPDPLLADVDSKRLRRAFDEVLENAVRFTPPDGRIRIRGEATEEAVRILVTDTGLGFPPQQADEIFQPFSQAHDTLEATEVGVGLGLAIARAIVEAHGGRIWAESDGRGKGATVGVELTVATPPEGDRKPS